MVTFLAGCGGGGGSDDAPQGADDGGGSAGQDDDSPPQDGNGGLIFIGGEPSQDSDSANFLLPVDLSQNSNLAPPSPPAAYWVEALIGPAIDQIPGTAGPGGVLNYTFPTQIPNYLTGEDRIGWEPATPALIAAYEEVFAAVEAVFDIRFVPTDAVSGPDVIAIALNIQEGTAAYAYFPSGSPIGYDIFHDIGFANPRASSGQTNFDYETVVHELGHAMGLKHPFEVDGDRIVTLPDAEDNSAWSSLTYNFASASYDGFFRDFDVMALARIYGVNPEYRAGNDTYGFSDMAGTFVIDGGGIDTISAQGLTLDVTINLASETQSHAGAKTALISEANQLTISANTFIENATGSVGNDFLIGNALDNRLEGRNGNDRLFGGEGEDRMIGGLGNDVIDLSEIAAARDTVVFESNLEANGRDLIANFDQGADGDRLEHDLFAGLSFLTVKAANVLQELDITDTIARISGTLIDSAQELVAALDDGGSFDGISMTSGSHGFLILAASSREGEAQHLFHLRGINDAFDVTLMGAFVGDEIDIDGWESANFV